MEDVRGTRSRLPPVWVRVPGTAVLIRLVIRAQRLEITLDGHLSVSRGESNIRGTDLIFSLRRLRAPENVKRRLPGLSGAHLRRPHQQVLPQPDM